MLAVEIAPANRIRQKDLGMERLSGGTSPTKTADSLLSENRLTTELSVAV